MFIFHEMSSVTCKNCVFSTSVDHLTVFFLEERISRRREESKESYTEGEREGQVEGKGERLNGGMRVE